MVKSKQKLRQEIFKGMCTCAENFMLYHVESQFINLNFINQCPRPFKPTLGDKKIFQSILDKVIDTAYVDYLNGLTNPKLIGVKIMCDYYYPQYCWWDEKDYPEKRLCEEEMRQISRDYYQNKL